MLLPYAKKGKSVIGALQKWETIIAALHITAVIVKANIHPDLDSVPDIDLNKMLFKHHITST